MSNLYAGNILKVDLSSGKITSEPTSSYSRAFLGGRGINIKLLYDNISPGVEALAPGNVLVFGVGPLGGTSVFTGRTEVTAKSPETGLLASTNFGGSFGGELKYAGYDHVVVKGKAEKPVYIWCNNDQVEIRDASGVWGKDSYETQDLLRKEVGNPEAKVACIGPAGENLVRFATVQHGLGHGAGRTGTGAVMGSKNLKAIVVRGTGGIKLADPVEFLAVSGELERVLLEDPLLKMYSEEGLSKFQDQLEEQGGGGEFRGPQPRAHAIYEKFKPKRSGCLGCPVQCMDSYQVKELGKGGSGAISCHIYAEWVNNVKCFDSAASLECGILSQRYGIDCISVSENIRWLMELHEEGVIRAEDTDGIAMEWGSPQAMRSMLDKITFREGIGDVLAEGILHAAEKIGRGSVEYANQVKGMPMSEELSPDWVPLLRASALAFVAGARGETMKSLSALAELWIAMEPEKAKIRKALLEEYAKYTGADIDVEKATAALETGGKAALFAHGEDMVVITDMLSTCKFTTPWITCPYVPEYHAKILSAGLGVEISPEDLFEYAIKVRNLERAYESMEGLTREIEKFPQRFHKPAEKGSAKGMVLELETLEKLKDDYYTLRGWDLETGTPTEEKLKEFGLDAVAEDLKRLRKPPAGVKEEDGQKKQINEEATK